MTGKIPRRARKFSTRLVRKGALLEETHRVFSEWNLALSFDENLAQARERNTPAADNEGWLKEVMTTLSSRWGDEPLLEAIVVLARTGRVDVWKACVLWHVGQIDELYYRFATEWLFKEFQEGAFHIRTSDVEPFVNDLTSNRADGSGALSAYGTTRAARDLLRMASDFGLLKGTSVREFSSYYLPEESFLYLLHAMYELHGNARDVVESQDWRLFLMSTADVERELLRLHQFRKLRYEVAGSLLELTLPYNSAASFAEEVSA